VPFGSRARGTQRPVSDWGIAIVLKGNTLRHPDPARSVFPQQQMAVDLPHFDVRALFEDDPQHRVCALGSLPHVICRDGGVLAGDWKRPDPARTERDAAILPIGKVLWRPLRTGSDRKCSHLLRNTADAALSLVKATMERRGSPADRSHDIARLAAAFAAHRPDEGALAERMAVPNGSSRVHQ